MLLLLLLLQGLILELLQSDVFSCQHIGLQALLNMVLSAPMVHSARSPGVTYPGSSPSQQVLTLRFSVPMLLDCT